MNAVTNPILWSDVPDVDVIRVGSSFYMISTSMHTMPGCPIMKSQNLTNWEIVNYVFDTLESNDAHNLFTGKNIYGQGSWAATLRYHNNTFYVAFSCNDTGCFYIYQTTNIENGDWKHVRLEGIYHDPALLFDESRVYVIYGNGEIYITELTKDVTAIQPNGIHQLLFTTETTDIGLRCEGCHAYKIDDYYYLIFIEWPHGGHKRRRQICYRSSELLGTYERQIILDDDMGYHNKGIAQGAIFDTPDHKWYAMLFQDHGAVGRIPYLLPVTWTNGWPMLGIEGKTPTELTLPLPSSTSHSLVISDDFNYSSNKLALNWQWNHNPDNTLWSVTERPGYLRLRTGYLTNSILSARNTLTQRTEGPSCNFITLMDTSNMASGDYAGLVALQSHFGIVGIKISSTGQRYITMSINKGDGTENVAEQTPFNSELVYLKIHFNFINSVDLANFYYSTDGINWITIGSTLKMLYTLDHFMGYRCGLFNYATSQIGGYVDFKYLHYERSY